MVIFHRELYYRDPELTGKQINVTDAVHDICCSLQASPWELGVFASAKGLLSGLLCITLCDDCVINCDGNMEGEHTSYTPISIYE